jgi:hypothetical protein
MKRIKLFEAFNNDQKVEKATFLLHCWVIKSFIIEEDLNAFYHKEGSISPESDAVFRLALTKDKLWFEYFTNGETNIFCHKNLIKFFNEKKITKSGVEHYFSTISFGIFRAAKHLLKGIADKLGKNEQMWFKPFS